MVEVERISIKKVFVGKAMVFGLWFGLVIGLIMAVMVIFAIFMSLAIISDVFGGIPGGAPVDNIILYSYALLTIPVSAFMFSLLSGLFALVYNLIVLLKGDVHLGMAEVIAEKAEVKLA